MNIVQRTVHGGGELGAMLVSGMLKIPYLYLCIFVFVHLCICVFVYLCIGSVQ